MPTDLIRYDLRVQDALRGVVRDVLAEAARNGLQGDHHFFITFKTNAPGLRLSNAMRERYPDEMTIILQHQFWDLAVTPQAFEVGLSFSNRPERLLVPFAAITGFVDPSVEFGLKFDVADTAEAAPETDDAPPSETLKPVPAKRALAPVETVAKPKTDQPSPKPVAEKPAASDPTKEPKADEGKKVVSIDAFRKKP